MTGLTLEKAIGDSLAAQLTLAHARALSAAGRPHREIGPLEIAARDAIDIVNYLLLNWPTTETEEQIVKAGKSKRTRL